MLEFSLVGVHFTLGTHYLLAPRPGLSLENLILKHEKDFFKIKSASFETGLLPSLLLSILLINRFLKSIIIEVRFLLGNGRKEKNISFPLFPFLFFSFLIILSVN